MTAAVVGSKHREDNMPTTDFLPELPDAWESTRATLHAYAHGVSALARTHAPAHPKWWHASLKVVPSGLVTDPIPLPDGGELKGRMDLERHVVVLETDGGESFEFQMTQGATGTEMADQVIATASGLGLGGEYDRAKFESDEPRTYDKAHAATFAKVLANIASVFDSHRGSLGASVSPLQMWPHGFDLSFEWFGTRMESHTENGQQEELPAQLNLGFYPAGEPYFYSNPWPFDASLTDHDLPHGASWNTEGWQGSKLPYAALVGDPDAAKKLADYASTVFEIASPTLLS
jgi:hypothetical protein